MKIKEIMTTDLITVSPDMDVHALARLFMEKDISGAPVVDKEGNYLGVVLEEGLIFQDKKLHLPTVLHLSMGFLTLGANRLEEEMKKISGTKVSDIMEKKTEPLSPDTLVREMATLIVEESRHYFPVLDGGQLKGVVTRKDIVRAIARGEL